MSSMIHNLLAGMTPREKRLVALMTTTAVVFIVFVVAFLVDDAVATNEEKIIAYKDTLTLIREKEAAFRDKKATDQHIENLGEPKPLRTLIDNVVQKSGVPEPDTKELTDQNYPGGWIEHGMEVSIGDIELPGLVKFMEEVESNRMRFPIAITKLEIRKNRREKSYYTVKMTISTYEKIGVDDTTKAAKGGR